VTKKIERFGLLTGCHMLVDIKMQREALLDRLHVIYNNVKSKKWKKMWKVSVPSIIKIFPWRLARQSLPSADVLCHRHMETMSTCGLCWNIDPWRHNLIECPMAKAGRTGRAFGSARTFLGSA
jgi:hypothetical protein